MSKHRGHRSKPKTPPHKKNGARLKEDRQQGSSRGGQSTNQSALLGARLDKEIDMPTGDTSSWGKGKVLKNIENPSEVKKDLALISRALKGRWNIPDQRKIDIQERLIKVLAKEEVTVSSKEGPVSIEEPADRNAVAAARVLVQMNGQDIECDQFDVKNGQPSTPGTIVNVINGNPAQPRPSPILQLAISLGATELTIDGSAVPVADSSRESEEA